MGSPSTDAVSPVSRHDRSRTARFPAGRHLHAARSGRRQAIVLPASERSLAAGAVTPARSTHWVTSAPDGGSVYNSAPARSREPPHLVQRRCSWSPGHHGRSQPSRSMNSQLQPRHLHARPAPAGRSKPAEDGRRRAGRFPSLAGPATLQRDRVLDKHSQHRQGISIGISRLFRSWPVRLPSARRSPAAGCRAALPGAAWRCPAWMMM